MIRVAIIGTGSIAASHLEAYSLFPERCQIAALINRHEAKAVQLRDRFELGCRIVQDYHELLESGEADLVSICTPPHSHAEIAADCLRAGMHVLVEKPMAMSLEECDRMLEAAESTGSLLSVVGQNRFLDSYMRLKHTLDSGLAGKIVHSQTDAFWWRGGSYYDVWWRGTWEQEGGGCTLNHGIHHLDLLQWMLGMPRSVQAVMSNTSHENSEVEDLSVAILSYPGGGLAQVTSSVVHHGEERQMIFQGQLARISSPLAIYATTQLENGFPKRNPALEKEIKRVHDSLQPLRYSGHAGQIDNVLEALENNSRQVLIDGYEGRKMIELVTAIYEAAITKSAVELPLGRESRFYSREGLLHRAPRYHT
ncbi:Gfo/Idh/MocA family protein [Paenibacillus sp. S150]|uniref:Gfo/Idh/MocA family protein n=1 Tax=Paenibacillus sp. S150 TaxID=2749826 RepID=UPI001C55E57E|nr:Gfo/Idh/MocA family oxidoreductase [Paenibacillus sp. S150]MBW4080287.1 Gfo/Idh/MocA family oxidoreductase [Paenibacillus sp. S150]